MQNSLAMDKLLATFPKYGKAPRPVQVQCLEALIPAWDKYRVHVITAPVATGKSLILRAIQEHTNAAILTSENTLVDQYGETFHDLNTLKGAARYSCMLGDTCATTKSQMDGKCCGGCPYTTARCRAMLGEHTVFNPMSYIVNLRLGNIEPARVLLIDEAHKLGGFLRQLGTVELKATQATFTAADLENSESILRYAKASQKRLERMVRMKRSRRASIRADLGLESDGSHNFGDGNLKNDAEMLDKLDMIIYALEDNPGDYICHVKPEGKGQTLTLEPIRPPRAFVRLLQQSEKIVMTSGTLFPHHIQDLVGGLPYSFTELPAPIPPERRIIKIEPCAGIVNKDTPPQLYASKIVDIMRRNQGKRGIIHATYNLANQLKPLLPDTVIVHSAHDKRDALAAFKNGGSDRWLLASGMAEGIDLSGELARVNIITKLQWPNLGDPYVLRRKSLTDGELWYLSTTLEHLIQAAGRTTRGVDDHSITYCLDPGIDRLVRQLKALTANDVSKQRQYLPQSFLDALRY